MKKISTETFAKAETECANNACLLLWAAFYSVAICSNVLSCLSDAFTRPIVLCL